MKSYITSTYTENELQTQLVGNFTKCVGNHHFSRCVFLTSYIHVFVSFTAYTLYTLGNLRFNPWVRAVWKSSSFKTKGPLSFNLRGIHCEPVWGRDEKNLYTLYLPPRMLNRITTRMTFLKWPLLKYHSYPKGGGRIQNLYVPLPLPHFHHTSTTPTNSSSNHHYTASVTSSLLRKKPCEQRRPRWGGSIDQQWLLWGAEGLGTAPRPHGTAQVLRVDDDDFSSGLFPVF